MPPCFEEGGEAADEEDLGHPRWAGEHRPARTTVWGDVTPGAEVGSGSDMKKGSKAKATLFKITPKKACGLCGKTGRLFRTECCGNLICDDYDNYKLFSFSRNSCARNHDRYTVCGTHHAEEHEGDWKACSECREHYPKLEMFVWAATNEFNFTKLENPPSFEPTHCGECKRVIRLSDEGYSIKGRDYFCTTCSPPPRF